MLYNDAAIKRNIWVWRSLVARLNGVQEAGSSNLLTQTTQEHSEFSLCSSLCRVRRSCPHVTLSSAPLPYFLISVSRGGSASLRLYASSLLVLRHVVASVRYSVASLLTNLLTQTKASRTLLVRDAFFQKPPLTRIVPPLLSPLKNARRSRTPRFLRCSKTIVQYARFCSAVSLRQKRMAMSARFPHTLIRSVLELRVHLFGVYFNLTNAHSETELRAAQPSVHRRRAAS